MTLGLAYWIIILVWTVFFLLSHFGYVGGTYGTAANIVLLWVLFVILGWATFGPPLHR